VKDTSLDVRKAEVSSVPTRESLVTKELQSQLPKFGPGELPVEYTPINDRVLKRGDRFGSLSFQISLSSHQHHLEYITRCNTGRLTTGTPNLYPFEFWPLPRVMSQWRFGRLNEVISIRADRIIQVRPQTDQKLAGETIVKSVAKRKGLCFGFFESTTKTAAGEICMVAEDVLSLANGCDPDKLREAVLDTNVNKVYTFVDTPSSILGSWILQMRYPWPVEKWRNNIHTDVYALSLGYERGLVEGPGIADVVYSIDETHLKDAGSFRLSWEYASPLYHGTQVVLIAEVSSNSQIRRYSVCEPPKEIPGKCRILLNLEIKQL